MSFHVEAVVKATGERVRMTRSPVSFREARTIKSKITEYPWRDIEITPKGGGPWKCRCERCK